MGRICECVGNLDRHTLPDLDRTLSELRIIPFAGRVAVITVSRL
jgi:hypothetical protein